MMPVLKSLAVGVPTRTINQQDEQWKLGDGLDDLAAEVEEVAKLLTESHGFRWHRKSWQNQQDRALRDYRNVMAMVLKINKVDRITVTTGEATDVNDRLVFPRDPEKLVQYICQ
jgi:hypothetical protein